MSPGVQIWIPEFGRETKSALLGFEGEIRLVLLRVAVRYQSEAGTISKFGKDS